MVSLPCSNGKTAPYPVAVVSAESAACHLQKHAICLMFCAEVSVAGRSASYAGMGDAAAFTTYAKQMSLSDVHMHVTVLVGLRSSVSGCLLICS